MFLCSCFTYTLLSNMKDSLIVTSVGAEVLPFLGSWAVLPGSILFYMYYSKVSTSLPQHLVYYAALLPFIIFYSLFSTVIYPAAAVLHPYHLLEPMKEFLPAGMVGLAGMCVNWTFSLFFVMAELWGAAAISLCFWGMADDVCSMQEAKDWFPVLGMIANVGLIIAGAWCKYVNTALAGGDPVTSFRWLTASIVGAAGILFAVKAWVDKHYMGAHHAEAEKAIKAKAKADKKAGKKSGGLSGAWDVVKASPKVQGLAVLVSAYFLTQKLFDFAWKAQLRVIYPSPVDYQAALSDVAQIVGVCTIVLMATSKFAFKHLGWRGTALISPVAIGIASTVFYTTALGSQSEAVMASAAGGMVVVVGAASGTVARVLSKASKYSLFDPAKEMVYITMDKAEKAEGKSAVDLLGSYFGKSGASWLTQALILGFGSLQSALPVVAAINAAVCVAWTHSTLSLAKLVVTHEGEDKGGVGTMVKEGGAAEVADTGPPAMVTPPPPTPVVNADMAAAAAGMAAEPSLAKAKGKLRMAGAGVLLMRTSTGSVEVDATLATLDEWVMTEEQAAALIDETHPAHGAETDNVTEKSALRSFLGTLDDV